MSNTNIGIFDGHNDVLLRLYRGHGNSSDTFFQRSNRGHLDLPRMREAGIAGGLFAVFVPQVLAEEDDHSFTIVPTDDGYEIILVPPIALDYAQRISQDMIRLLRSLEEKSAGQFKIVTSYDDLVFCFDHNIMSAVLHFEGAEPIEANLDSLPMYYEQGLRSLGIFWSRPNVFGTGVPYRFPHSPDIGPGLTDAGRALVTACNQMGILIDLAHSNDQGFWDVARSSSAPLVVSHTAAYALCPISRNVTDEQLDAVYASGGVVGINFAVRTLRTDGRPNPDTPLNAFVQHVVYVAERIGVDHVAFGSDFDGTTIPTALQDVTGVPQVITLLRQAGFSDAELRKICQENWLRVIRATWH